MFSLASAPQFQVNDEALVSHKNDHDMKRISDLVETMLRGNSNSTSFQDGQQGYVGLLNKVAMIHNV